MRILRPAAVIAIACAVGACAQTLPRGKSAEHLYRDLQRLVTLEQTQGWRIDRLEVSSMLGNALMSVCATEPAVRQELMAWLDEQIAARGGPVELAWRRRGKNKRKVSGLLELTRIRKTLARAIETSNEDCPFWVEPKPRFAGRQISDDRWTFSLGGGGRVIFLRQAGDEDVNFGGAGRVVFGRTIGRRLGLYTGVEVGASAGLPGGADGEGGSLEFGLDTVVPLVARIRGVNTYLEIEVGPMFNVTDDDVTDVDPGYRVGIAIGGRTTRRRFLFPGAAFGISYEQTFQQDEKEPPRQTIRLGFRVAFDIDL